MILKVQRTYMSFKSRFGALVGAGGSWFGLPILILIWMRSLVLIHSWSDFWHSILILKVQRTSISFKSWFEDLVGAGGSRLGSGILIMIWIWSMVFDKPMFQILSWYLGHWSLIYLWSEFWLSIVILKVQRTSMSFTSSFGAWEDAEGSLLGFGILILILIWSLVFDISMIQILALYLDFEGAKNIHVLLVIIWGFGGCWRFLTGVWHPDLDFDMVTGLLYTHDPNFGPLS